MPAKVNASPNVLLMRQARAPVSLQLQTKEKPDSFDIEDGATVTRLWDLHPSLHCSIIGTCLTAAELRQILKRAGLSGIEGTCDHDLHSIAVGLCIKPQAGSKFLNKALNRKHRAIIKNFAGAATPGELKGLWQEFLEKGDIPGAYWAVLTHPLTDKAVAQKAFGDVHMLSHLVGASNRAGIRRLRQLEEDNNLLLERSERQAKRFRESIAARDRKISALMAALAHAQAAQAAKDAANPWIAGEPPDLVAELEGKLQKQAAHAAQLEGRLKESREAGALAQAEHTQLFEQIAGLKAEIVALEALLSSEASGSAAFKIDLRDKTLLYVGGRPHQLPQLKKLAEGAGACFLHHDGGIEESNNSLAALVARADAVLFPADCVSHGAVATVKRICGQLGKDYFPMRSSGLSSFAKAVHRLSFGRAPPMIFD
jgi:hypothetical protein